MDEENKKHAANGADDIGNTILLIEH